MGSGCSNFVPHTYPAGDITTKSSAQPHFLSVYLKQEGISFSLVIVSDLEVGINRVSRIKTNYQSVLLCWKNDLKAYKVY